MSGLVSFVLSFSFLLPDTSHCITKLTSI
jgi:hypothetical protein